MYRKWGLGAVVSSRFTKLINETIGIGIILAHNLALAACPTFKKSDHRQPSPLLA